MDERNRLQTPDDLADAKLDSDTLIRIARRAGLDPISDPETLGELRQRSQRIFESEQRRNDGKPLGWEAKQGILKKLVDDEIAGREIDDEPQPTEADIAGLQDDNEEKPQTADEIGGTGAEDANTGNNAAPVLTKNSEANKPESPASNDGVNPAGSDPGAETSAKESPDSLTAVAPETLSTRGETEAKGVLTPNGKYAPFIDDNPEIVHPTDDAEALKSAQCPGNSRCKPPGEWEKYNPGMPRPKVSERKTMQGGVVFPNGWFIPPAWKEEKTTLGTIGEMIHSVPDLKYPFPRFLFDRYYRGVGKDVELTPEQFKDITDYIAKHPETEKNKPDESKGEKYVTVKVGDKTLTRKTYSLYGHPGYGASLGNVMVYFDEEGKPVGFYDNYNFNIAFHRDIMTNAKIAAVRLACQTDPNANCKPFDISYGDYVNPNVPLISGEY